MVKSVTVVVNEDSDERVIQSIAGALRSNNTFASQLRDFTEAIADYSPPNGLKFNPTPGQILICHFGLGFQNPEICKVRPVLIVSPHRNYNTGLSIVIPISHVAPDEVKPYHYKLPDGLVPNNKYKEAWLKGDLVQTVGHYRLDRLKTGFRQYESPIVPVEVLKEARRCILHAAGMHILTNHW